LKHDQAILFLDLPQSGQHCRCWPADSPLDSHKSLQVVEKKAKKVLDKEIDLWQACQ
jgi:hypothetical protein